MPIVILGILVLIFFCSTVATFVLSFKIKTMMIQKIALITGANKGIGFEAAKQVPRILNNQSAHLFWELFS